MKILCYQSDELVKCYDTKIETQNVASKQFVEELKDTAIIDRKVAGHLTTLWADKGIQTTYEHRSLYRLNDSMSYFLDRIERIGDEKYAPTEEDVLYSHSRTTQGIVEADYILDGHSFRMFDVSGQRNERRKWIHCFSDDVIPAVLFVVSLNEYDMCDEYGTNLMQESLNFFDEICNSRWFRKASFTLLLNKRDLFAEKIRRIPLTKCFADYEGLNTYEATSHYIQQQFHARNKNPEKLIYTHMVCAVDINNMEIIFRAMRDTLIRITHWDVGLI